MLRMLLIYAHIISCCIALGSVFILDIKLIKNKFILNEYDKQLFQQLSSIVSYALLCLWITGILIIIIDLNFNIMSISDKPKILAKLTVVLILTLNGIYLHKKLFPKFIQGIYAYKIRECISAVISCVSWFFAAFLGIAKPLASILNYEEFILIYISLIIYGCLFVLAKFKHFYIEHKKA